MKYSIYANQLAAQMHFPELDILDLAILDYFKDFAHNAQKFIDDKGAWFWISNQKVIDDLPIIKINSKRGIQKRVDKIIDAGILERNPDSKKLNRSYYRFTEKLNLYLQNTPSDQQTQGLEREFAPANENSQVGTNESSHLRTTVRTPANENSHDTYIKDYSIKEKLKEENKKSVFFYSVFLSLFKEKFNADYLPPKSKNKTYQINAIEELLKLRPNDLEKFLADCFNLNNSYYLNKIAPAHILANYSEYCAAIATNIGKGSGKNGLTYAEVREKVTANTGLSFNDFERVGEGKNAIYYPVGKVLKE